MPKSPSFATPEVATKMRSRRFISHFIEIESFANLNLQGMAAMDGIGIAAKNIHSFVRIVDRDAVPSAAQETFHLTRKVT